MPFRDRNTTTARNRWLLAGLLAAMHESRRRQAAHILSENEPLISVSDVTERPGPMSQPQQTRGPAVARRKRLSPLLATLAVLLIAAHAVCATLIIDRALAHASESIAVNQGD